MKKIVLIILVVIIVIGTAVPAIAFNGGFVPDPLSSGVTVTTNPIIYCSTPICTGRLRGRIDRTATSVARLLITPSILQAYDDNEQIYSWAVKNCLYNMTVNEPMDFDLDLTTYISTPGNYNILYTDGLRVLSQYNFVYVLEQQFLKKVDLSGLTWNRNSEQTTIPITTSIGTPLASVDVNYNFVLNYVPKSNSLLLVKFSFLYLYGGARYSPCFFRRSAGPSSVSSFLYNVNLYNSAYPYYFLVEPAFVSNFSLSIGVYSQVTKGNFSVSGVEIYELQTSEQKDTQIIVDALNDPSYGSTDQSGAVLNDGTNNASDMLNNGGNKEDQLVDGSISGADTSRFESSVTDSSLIAGLRFWREFFEFSYNQLDFYQVIVGLCVTLGTLALVLGVSGRVHNYRARNKKEGKKKE